MIKPTKEQQRILDIESKKKIVVGPIRYGITTLMCFEILKDIKEGKLKKDSSFVVVAPNLQILDNVKHVYHKLIEDTIGEYVGTLFANRNKNYRVKFVTYKDLDNKLRGVDIAKIYVDSADYIRIPFNDMSNKIMQIPEVKEYSIYNSAGLTRTTYTHSGVHKEKTKSLGWQLYETGEFEFFRLGYKPAEEKMFKRLMNKKEYKKEIQGDFVQNITYSGNKIYYALPTVTFSGFSFTLFQEQPHSNLKLKVSTHRNNKKYAFITTIGNTEIDLVEYDNVYVHDLKTDIITVTIFDKKNKNLTTRTFSFTQELINENLEYIPEGSDIPEIDLCKAYKI